MCTVNHCDYDPQSLFYIFQKYTCWLAVILTLRPQNISKIWIWPGTFVTSLSLISCYPLLLCNKDTPPQKKTNKKNKTSPVSLRWSNSPFFQVHIAISCDRKIFGVIILQEKWPFWQCWMLLISEGYSFSDTHHIGREIAFFFLSSCGSFWFCSIHSANNFSPLFLQIYSRLTQWTKSGPLRVKQLKPGWFFSPVTDTDYQPVTQLFLF